jgi:MFS transporter, DHA1 family, tetracycline resistance protein
VIEERTIPASRLPGLPIVLVAVAVDSLGLAMILPVLPGLLRGQGAVIVGAVGSLFAVAQLAGVPLLGVLSDRIGRRPVLAASLLGACAAGLLLAAAPSDAVVAVAIVGRGLTGGTVTAAQAWIADSSGEQNRAARLALLGLAQGGGMLAGPAAGGLLGAASPRLVPLAVAALSAGAALLAALALREPALRERRASLKPARTGVRAALAAVRAESRPLAGTLAVVALLNLAFAGVPLNLPVLARDRLGWGGAQTGVLLTVGGLSVALAQGLLVRPLRRLAAPERLVRGGAFALAALLPVVGFAVAPWQLLGGVALLAVAASVTVILLTEVVTLRAPGGRHGAALGAMNAASAAAIAVAPLAAGLLYERVHPAAPYLAGAAAALAAWAAAGRLGRGGRAQ